jgi:hypothetical protein
MPDWLQKLADHLDAAPAPIRLFCRDDDAGWADDRLFALLDVFAGTKMPIDLAVIPAALDNPLADELLARKRQAPGLLGLHQHGYSHTNHEPEQLRKCEFGATRGVIAQASDLACGKQKMDDLLGTANDPVFTPPWNRCSQEAVDCLVELGFEILSRDVSAKPLSTGILKQAPVSINWSRIIKTSHQPESDIADQLVSSFTQNPVTGIMFHHADMAPEHLTGLTQVLNLLHSHPHVQAQRIKHVAQ